MICYSDWRDLGGGRDERPRRLSRARPSISSRSSLPTVASCSFSSYREGTLALWRVPAGGGEPTRLTLGSGPESQPSVAADGSRLAYATWADNYGLVSRIRERRSRRDRQPARRDRADPRARRLGARLVRASAVPARLWVRLSNGRRSVRGDGSPIYGSDRPAGAFAAATGSLRGRRAVCGRSGPPRRRQPRASRTSRSANGGGDDRLPTGRRDGPRDRLCRTVAESGTPSWTPPAGIAAAIAAAGEPLTTGQAIGVLSPARSGRRRVRSRSTDAGRHLVVTVRRRQRRPDRRLEAGARLRWNRTTGELWLAAAPESAQPRLDRIPAAGGGAVEVRGGAIADAAPGGEFDVITADGRLLVYTRQQTRGDVWLLEADRRAF